MKEWKKTKGAPQTNEGRTGLFLALYSQLEGRLAKKSIWQACAEANKSMRPVLEEHAEALKGSIVAHTHLKATQDVDIPGLVVNYLVKL